MESKSWNGHEGGSRVESDKATVGLARANVKILSVNFNIVKLDTEHVLEADVVPVDVTVELGLVEVPEGQVGLDTEFLFVLDRSEIEREYVAVKELLINHLVEYWGHTSLGKGWVRQSYNSLKVRAGENSVLLLNITKLLILDMNLST